jgi:ferredoxin
MLKKIRTILAIVMLVLVTLLFLGCCWRINLWFGFVAKIQFLPALLSFNIVVVLLLLLLTLLLGRVYCSVICPLGIMQDCFSWLHGKFKKNRFSYSPEKKWLRYIVLGIFVVLLIVGVTPVTTLLAPYSAYGRIVNSLFKPLYDMLNNALAHYEAAHDLYHFSEVEIWMRSVTTFVVAIVTLLVLAVLAWRHGRTYCNTICPVGTVLGYVSKCSRLKMQIEEDKCIKCGLCAKNCKAACIDIQKEQPGAIDPTRCIVCGNCMEVCNKQAIHLAPIGNKRPATKEDAEGLSRRSFISVVGTATVAAALHAQEKTTDGGLAEIEDKQIPQRKTPLTPAGSLSARNLQQHCTACQLCVANCPNGVLRSSTDLEHFLQPTMGYEKGYCRPECTRCADVCPAGAIHPITKEEKTAIQIGHAVWIQQNCVPAEEGIPCGNCARHCPSGAIQMVPLDKELKQNEQGQWVDEYGTILRQDRIIMVPAVNTEKCIGCGACEYVCPARPFSAIYVEGHEVHREI